MNYPSIRIEGAILSPDILEGLHDDTFGQRPADFGLDSGTKVKDEIARAWADAQDYWRIFQRKLETLKADSPATTETRNLWMVPVLGLMGYQLEYQPKATELNGKTYAISHRVVNRAYTPLHIIGYQDAAGLDKKPERTHIGTPRMSAHGLVQEYLNLHDELYGIVTNGRVLRLLRDSSRLIKLTYLEFDLDRIFTDGLFADFAVLYRLLHVSRFPAHQDSATESLLERYHQDSLDSGARIRDGLSKAVEQAIKDFANGFLSHPHNDELRNLISTDKLSAEDYYSYLLHLIYRLLFLMVIEERNLVFPNHVHPKHRDIYQNYYSLQRLRKLAEKRHLADQRHHDLWLSLLTTFQLFESEITATKLGLAPLAGDLFSPQSIAILGQSSLANDILLGCLRSLSLYQHPDNGQLLRVNYAALNVEEFGSVYEGLLEYQPVFLINSPMGYGNKANIDFDFARGDKRAATGSHYTPDELVQPLIKHSLDYLIADKLKETDREAALLSLRVADIACGSGHILLAAARRIAIELAIVRTDEEQPSPPAIRAATRDVIKNCIYGVDLNPLAVELCKVALWLEAHIPGEPLNFLDHHIKCGNAIVGFAKREELERGIPDEAFANQPSDEKDIAALFRKQNKKERENPKQILVSDPVIEQQLDAILNRWQELSSLPEQTPTQIDQKKQRFVEFSQSQDAKTLKEIAALPIAQFYIEKTNANKYKLITDAEYRRYLKGQQTPQGQAVAEAFGIADRKRFFHWFLEYPEVMSKGGFDCILGNPPYLGGKKLSGTYGDAFLSLIKLSFYPAGGLSDLVVYFVRRMAQLTKPKGFLSLISTNTIAQGDSRAGGIGYLCDHEYSIVYANKSVRWPGRAVLEVSLIAINNGLWIGKRFLNDMQVPNISPLLTDEETEDQPSRLNENSSKSFIGCVILGTGFLLEPSEAVRLISDNPKNREILQPYLSGADLNGNPQQRPSRWAINFRDWSIEKAQGYSECFSIVDTLVRPHRETVKRDVYRQRWWQYAEKCSRLYETIQGKSRVLVVAQTSKTVAFIFVPASYVFSMMTVVFNIDKYADFAVYQSTFHNVWAWKYASTLKSDLRYVPTDIAETFPRPILASEVVLQQLEISGRSYHEHRDSLMNQLWLGLTDIYNLFHTRDLTPERVAKVSKKSSEQAQTGYQGLLELRRLHVQLDTAVRDAYGWHDLNLEHDFHEVETLPENDRVRYTISPTARKEVLKRLLAENHRRAAEQSASISTTKPKTKRPRKSQANEGQGDLFQ
jgi:hypothetical protein